MSLRNAVTPRNDAYSGGTISRNGQPPDVSGSFGNPGTAGFTNPGVPAILSARNNSGSNIRVPYARVVPLHAKDALPVKDLGLIGTGQKTAYEYDGLESGELAWVLGKSFSLNADRTMIPSSVEYSVMATQMPMAPPGMPGVRMVGGVAVGVDGAPLVPHSQPNGYGPDRMQRLAYTAWIESHFITRVGRQTLDLARYNPFDTESRAIDSELDYWAKHGAGANDAAGAPLPIAGAGGGPTLFAMPDLAYAFQSPVNDVRRTLQLPLGTAMPQGLFVMERGPFLRSIGTDCRPIDVEAHIGGDVPQAFVNKQSVSRHLGSDLAQKGLEVYLKRSGVFNWVPDGVCLSKYETGPNGQADAEMDARASQLFNVAVQGPAIVKTWTHDPKLQCMPMDKVFICVVGDLSYTVADGAALAASRMESAARMTELIARYTRDATGKKRMITEAEAQAIHEGYTQLGGVLGQGPATRAGAGPLNTASPALAAAAASPTEQAFAAWVGRTGPFPVNPAAPVAPAPGPPAVAGERDGIRGYEETVATGTQAQIDAMMARADGLWAAYRATFGFGAAAPRTPEAMLDRFDEDAAAVRRGELAVTTAKLSNLRLMRATSSFLAQYSHYSGSIESDNRDKRDSRLGLPIEYTDGGGTAGGSGGGSYIVGAWCIGTVLDSAASRSAMNNTVRTAPASMALNIAVNVEWWSADKLYQHYQDKERYLKSTGNIAAVLGAAAGNDPEDAATVAQAKLPDGGMQRTVAMRTELREAEPRKFSMDLDVEAYPSDAVRPVAARAPASTNAFRRGWNAIEAA